MVLRILLSDYRCFRREQPAVIELTDGFIAYIGPNNAGKSTILKSFYELRPVYQRLTNLTGYWGQQFNSTINISLPAPITDPTEIINDRPDGSLSIEIQLVDMPTHSAGARNIDRIKLYLIDSNSNWRIEVYVKGTDTALGHPNNPVVEISSTGIGCQNLGQVSTAGIQAAAQKLTNVLYIGAFRNAINDGSAQYFDLQIGSAFIDVWHAWKTGGVKSQNRATSKVTDDVARLLGVHSLEINASRELKTLQIVIEGRHYKLSELGSGIAELIVVLANVAIARPPIVAIDEPEAHLHPKLQAEFLTSLGSYSQSCVLFSTHVLGLARAIGDRVFSVQRDGNSSRIRRLDRRGNYAELLGSLGIAALQEIGFDTVLLVEGVTDVRTFQQFLRQMGLDHRVVVIPLGGSSLINGKIEEELAEVRRLSPQVFVAIDSERVSKDAALAKDRRDFLEVCNKLQIKSFATSRPCTESYFSDRAIKVARGDQFSALPEYQKPESIPWGKETNWLIAREMTQDELMQTDLGAFLRSIGK